MLSLKLHFIKRSVCILQNFCPVSCKNRRFSIADRNAKLILPSAITECPWKLRELTDEDIKKIADTYNAYVNGTLEDVKGFCAVVDTEKIAEQDYILTPGRYVGVEEQEDDGEPFEEKMVRLTSELSDLFKQSHKLEAEIKEKLGAIGYEI